MSRKQVAVRLVAEGGRQVRAEFQGVGDSGERAFQRIERQADSSGAALNRVMAILGTAVSVRQLTRYADSWTDLQARVNLATGSQEAGVAVMERVGEIARRTFSSLEQTAEGWLSNVTVLRELGMTISDTLDFQEAMNNALVVSGARADRAAQVQNALSQAMALGALRGQQLNTVIANGGRVAELLAEELGTTVGGLRQVGMQGLITGDVIRRALIGNLEQLRAEADSMPATIGDAFTLIGNAALQVVGKWDQLTATSASIAAAMILLADNLERAAAIAIAFAGFMAVRWVAAFVAARVATMNLVGALVALRAALIRTGIGALIVLAGELIYRFGGLVTATGNFGEALSELWALARGVFRGLVASAAAIPSGLRAIWARVTVAFLRMVEGLRMAWGDFLADMADGVRDSGLNIGGVLDGAADRLGQASARAYRTAQQMSGALNEAERDAAAAQSEYSQRIAEGWSEAREALARLRELMAAAGDESIDINEDLAVAIVDVEGALGRAGAAAQQVGEQNKQAAEAAAEGWARVTERLGAYRDEATDLYGQIGDAAVSAFRAAENSLDEFVRTGRLSIGDFTRSVIADFARIGARQFLLGPLANALTGALGGLGGGLTGGAKLPSFAGGGHTGWGARSGGLDGRGGFLAINHPRERIIDETRTGGRQLAPVINFNVTTPDAESFRRSRTQIMSDLARAVSSGQRGM